MRTLGVSGSSNALFLAVAENGVIEDARPYTVSEPAGLAPNDQLVAVRDEVTRILEAFGISRLRVLDAESSYSASYAALRPRVTLEAVVLLAAAETGVDAGRQTRGRVRSLLGLPRSGSLASHVRSVTPPVGGSWTNKRDLAALVALAAEKE